VTEFREELAKGFDEHYHDLALAHVLENNPQVVPSYARLSPKYQKLIMDSLSVDFQFSQFLQAENLPANLVVLKEKLQPHGDDGFAFFCFRIFTQTCGKLGTTNLNGSLFMTESEFQRFRPGLDALQQLRTLDAEEAYQAFLRFRGSKALSRFASKEHQALARILCLGAAFDYQEGNALCDAFDSLSPASQALLTRWLTSDGIHVKPGYILCHVPMLLQHAKNNQAVGLKAAFEMMLRVQTMCEQTVSARTAKVVVHFTELAAWAKDAGPDLDEFAQAIITLRSECHTNTMVFTVEVSRPETRLRGGSLIRSGRTENPCRWRFLYLILFLSCLLALAALAYPTLAVRYEHDAGLHDTSLLASRIGRYGLIGVAACSFLLLSWACWYRNTSQAVVVYEGVEVLETEKSDVASTGHSSHEPLLSSRKGYVRLEQADDGDVV